jgi:hypothetical protein
VLIDLYPDINVIVKGPEGQRTESVQALLPYLYVRGSAVEHVVN